MSVCRLYMKSGNVIELHGRAFSTKHGRMENDLRSISYDKLDPKRGDPLWIDVANVEAVVVSDK